MEFTRNGRRVFLLGLTSLGGLRLARADLYDDYINSKSKQPFVAFLARKGVPGHTFVGVGVNLEAGLVVYERVFGYYPDGQGKASQVKLVFGKSSPGKLLQKWEDLTWDVSLIHPVSDAQREAALKVVDKWKSNDPRYDLYASDGKNCNSLAAEVAAAVGLKVPPGAGSTLPPAYLGKLKDLNK